MNSRLDELQAAILRARLPRLRAAHGRERRVLAAPVSDRCWQTRPSPFRRKWIPDTCIICSRSEPQRRTPLQDRLRASGIETLVHYPDAISQQPAFAATDPADCPDAVRAANEVLSLPLYPGLSVEAVTTVAEAVRKEPSS